MHSDTQVSEDGKLESASFALQTLEAEERKLVRKLDRRILPIACLLYLFASLDRSNLGNARLQGLPKDILGGDPTGKRFDWANSVFFLAYILCQVPFTITSKLFPPRVWLACMAVGWGLSSTLMSTVFNFGGLITGRIFLGIFEAGFGPVIPLYFSFFYTKAEMGLRMAYFFGFAAVAGSCGGLIAFGVQHVHAASIHDWRILFIIEGLPAILMGLVVFCFLPNRPESTAFLNERERAIALDRMNRATSGDVGAKVNRAHIPLAFRDWRIYVGGAIYFGLNCALASISAFFPTVIATFGFTNAVAQILTVPPYAVAAIILVPCSFVSDRLQSRGLFMAVAGTISGISYVLMLTVPFNVHVRYLAVFFIVGGTYMISLIVPWFAHNLGSETKRATGIPIFMSIGHCGSVLGSHIFPLTEGPRYIKGFGISCALAFLAAVLSIVLSISYRMENARRDKLYGKPILNGRVDTSELADKANDFRYVC